MARENSRVNREIRNYTDAVFWGLSWRQTICAVLAVLVCVTVYLTIQPRLGAEATSWICILLVLPLGMLGFFRWHGMHAEQVLMAWLRDLCTPGQLKWKNQNAWQRLLEPLLQRKEQYHAENSKGN